MRPFMYIILLVLLAMLYKTFYWDYHNKESASEINTSTEAPAVSEPEPLSEPKPLIEPEPVQTSEPTKDPRADEQNRTGWQSRKGMPIERLGDTIGESLKDKVKVK